MNPKHCIVYVTRDLHVIDCLSRDGSAVMPESIYLLRLVRGTLQCSAEDGKTDLRVQTRKHVGTVISGYAVRDVIQVSLVSC